MLPQHEPILRYIVVPPTQFTLRQSINPLSNHAHSHISHKKAMYEFGCLTRLLQNIGVNPIVVPPAVLDPRNMTPDIIYSANWGLSLPLPSAPFILSRMKSPYRRPESAKVAGYMLSHHRTNMYELPPATLFEGTGLACWGGSHLWIAYGVRTSYKDAVALKRKVCSIYRENGYLPPQIYLLHIRSPWYDLDLAFLAFPNGRLLYRPDAFMPHSLRKIKEVFGDAAVPFTIPDSPFGLNAKIINGHVLCGSITDDARRLLRRVGGMPVISCPLTYAEKGGGSLRCCVLDYYIPQS
jgi:N-dimethylarginine dimethylaminohydrolase